MTHVEAVLRRDACPARGSLRLLAALIAVIAPVVAQTQDPPARPEGESRRPQNGEAATLDRLRADLAQPGAEGARQRLAAIEHLLSLGVTAVELYESTSADLYATSASRRNPPKS